jgi:hypothetical protein
VAGLAERWNGHRWRSVPVAQPAPHVTGATRNEFVLASVSCASPKLCVAVGRHSKLGATGMLAMAYNGKHWHQYSLPKPVYTSRRVSKGALAAVACPTKSRCLAAGTSNSGAPQAKLRTSRGWRSIAVPHQLQTPSGAELSSVSCATADFCLIGEVSTGTRHTALVGQFTDGRLHVAHAKAPKGTQAIELFRVSCFGHSTCVALGDRQIRHGDQYDTVAVVEHLHSGRWSLASHQGLGTAYITGLSCLSTSHCAAGGADTNEAAGFYASET